MSLWRLRSFSYTLRSSTALQSPLNNQPKGSTKRSAPLFKLTTTIRIAEVTMTSNIALSTSTRGLNIQNAVDVAMGNPTSATPRSGGTKTPATVRTILVRTDILALGPLRAPQSAWVESWPRYTLTTHQPDGLLLRPHGGLNHVLPRKGWPTVNGSLGNAATAADTKQIFSHV